MRKEGPRLKQGFTRATRTDPKTPTKEELWDFDLKGIDRLFSFMLL